MQQASGMWHCIVGHIVDVMEECPNCRITSLHFTSQMTGIFKH
jgi:hypothetical protein